MVRVSFKRLLVSIISISLLSLSLPHANAGKVLYLKPKVAERTDLQNLSFKSSNVVVNGKRYSYASESPLTISYTPDIFSFKSGCNTFSGSYSLSKGILSTGVLGSTKIGCDRRVAVEDLWLKELFSSKPVIKVEYISPKSKVKGSSVVLSISSKVTPTLGKGSVSIKMVVVEEYGYADSPIANEESEGKVNALCAKLIASKADENEARTAAESGGFLFRVVGRDGEEYAVTADYRANRMSIKSVKGVVVYCRAG
ncbi:MAG: META domain-containing protein [Candidatus Paceibacterota bacterium]